MQPNMVNEQMIPSEAEVAVANKPAGTPKRTRRFKCTAEGAWRMMFCCMVPIFSAIFYSIFGFHQKLDRDGIPHGKFADLTFAVLAACFWHIIKTSWEYNVWLKVLPYVEDRHQGLERIHRAKRISKWAFDVLYYSISTIFAFAFFYPIMPNLLFGEQECGATYSNFPAPVRLSWVKEFYLIQIGSFLQKIVDQLVKKRNDVKFWEYFLHHFLAFCLMFQSYVANYDRVGILVLITHDTTDIFLSCTRAQESLKYKIPVVFPAFFIVTFFVWTYLRGVVYTFCEVVPSLEHLWNVHYANPSIYAEGNLLSDGMFIAQLVILATMNYYWIFALAQVFYKNVRVGNASKIMFGKSYINSYDPTLLKASSMHAVK